MPVSNELWDAALGAGWTCYRKRRRGFGMMSSDLLERRDCENCWQVPYLFLCSCSTFGQKIAHYCYDEKLCSIILYLEGWPHLSHSHYLREPWDCIPNSIRYWDENRVWINLLDAGTSQTHFLICSRSLQLYVWQFVSRLNQPDVSIDANLGSFWDVLTQYGGKLGDIELTAFTIYFAIVSRSSFSPIIRLD